MTNDTIADMLTRIRNANLAKHQIVQIPATKITRSIAKVLLNENLISSFEELKNGLKSLPEMPLMHLSNLFALTHGVLNMTPNTTHSNISKWTTVLIFCQRLNQRVEKP